MHSTQKTLRLIAVAAFASMASMRICDPMLVDLAREFQATTGDASRVIAAFAVAYGVLQLFYGPLGDRLGKIRVVVAATFACALFSALTAMAPTLQWLVLGRGAMGAAAAGIIPLSMAWIGDQVPYDQRQETLARLMVATVSGMMAGQWFGGMAAQTLGWRTAFMVLSAVFLLAAFMLHRKTRHDPRHRPADGAAAVSTAQYFRNTLQLIRMPRVRWVLTIVTVEGALAFGTLAFVPSRLVDGFGFSVSAAGATMILYGVGGLIYSHFARRWLGLLGEKGLALTGGTLIACGLLALAWARLPALAIAACFLAGLGFYMLHNTLQTQATQMAPESRGTAVTLFACLLFLGQSCGVLLIAVSVDHGSLAATFSIAAVGILVLSGLISKRVQSRNR